VLEETEHHLQSYNLMLQVVIYSVEAVVAGAEHGQGQGQHLIILDLVERVDPVEAGRAVLSWVHHLVVDLLEAALVEQTQEVVVVVKDLQLVELKVLNLLAGQV
jgi:hypothetical protein